MSYGNVHTSLFFFSSSRRHTRSLCDWSSDVCSSDLVQRGAQAAEQASREPEKQGEADRGQAAAPPHHARHGALHALESLVAPLPTPGRGRKQARQQMVQVHLLCGDLVLDEVAGGGEQQRDEGDEREQEIEGERAGEKRDVIVEGRFERA